MLAQTIAPSASIGDQAIADILYGQDQLPSTLSGPNNPLAIFTAQEAGTGTESFTDYVTAQQGRLTEVENLLDAFLAAAQQAATTPNAGDLATANAPTLTYGVLAQLASGARLDTDAVTVESPGTQTTRLGVAVTRPLTAVSTAGARVTAWSAKGLPPGLSISTAGKITGKPAKTGTFKVTVKATDTIGTRVHNTGQVTFTWVVAR